MNGSIFSPDPTPADPTRCDVAHKALIQTEFDKLHKLNPMPHDLHISKLCKANIYARNSRWNNECIGSVTEFEEKFNRSNPTEPDTTCYRYTFTHLPLPMTRHLYYAGVRHKYNRQIYIKILNSTRQMTYFSQLNPNQIRPNQIRPAPITYFYRFIVNLNNDKTSKRCNE